MIENLIVVLIVCAAMVYAWRRWIGATAKTGGCGSGCSNCGSCDSAPATPPGPRVIMMHKAGD